MLPPALDLWAMLPELSVPILPLPGWNKVRAHTQIIISTLSHISRSSPVDKPESHDNETDNDTGNQHGAGAPTATSDNDKQRVKIPASMA